MLRTAIRSAIALLALTAAAHAGTRMYSGSLSYHAFGNDTTTGTTFIIQNDRFIGMPFGRPCNVGPYHSEESFTIQTPYDGRYVTITLPRYGGQAAIHDTNADGVGDQAYGCDDAGRSLGGPIYADGQATTTGIASVPRTPMNPRGLNLPAGRFTFSENGTNSNASYGPYAWSVQYGNFENAPASFRAGAGIGDFTWSETKMYGGGQARKRGKVVVTEGPNRFGGTMRMLGTFYTNSGFSLQGALSVGDTSWLFQYHGGGGVTNGIGELTQPGFASAPNTGYTILSGRQIPRNVFGLLWSWTTGTVSVTAVHGPFPTVLARHGFDNRNSTGAGEIQMVTPMLTRWVWTFGNYETASVGVLKLNFAPEPHLNFAPEPHQYALLGVGIGLLALLYRSNRRSR